MPITSAKEGLEKHGGKRLKKENTPITSSRSNLTKAWYNKIANIKNKQWQSKLHLPQ
jgi:hypothetical protein